MKKTNKQIKNIKNKQIKTNKQIRKRKKNNKKQQHKKEKNKKKIFFGDTEFRSRCLVLAKHALFRLSYTPKFVVKHFIYEINEKFQTQQ